MDMYRIITRKHIVVCLSVFLCLVTLTAAFARSSIGASAGTQARRIPIYCVGRGDDQPKQLSLTFDAAWGNEDTAELIEILGKYNIHATFFCVASWVDKFPESVKQLSDAGHEIMNHSTTHPHMSQLSREEMRREIQTCNEKIAAITGKTPTLFRAPYGEYCDTLIEVLDEMGMKCIQWDVDSLDWKDPPPSEICSRVCGRVKNGSIVLFHNAAANTPAALPQTIEGLIANGYSFAPVSQSIYYESYTIDHEGRQWCDKINESEGAEAGKK